MNLFSTSRMPFCRLLSGEDLARIDRTSRKILQNLGIKVLDEFFLRFFKDAGLNVDLAGQRVFLESDWIDETLAKAPRRFVLHSRDGKNDVYLGNGSVHFANGGRVFRIIDPFHLSQRPSQLKDVAQIAKLVDHLEYLKFYIIACQAHDLEQSQYHLNDFYYAFRSTSKHVMGGCDSLAGVRQVWDLAKFMAGDEKRLKAKPFFSVITNPISPLIMETNTLSILQFCAQNGIPVTCAPAPIAGATSPATLAGTLAQMHAEALAGVALAQVFAPGSKILYGAVPTAMDLRTMEFTMGSVETSLMNASAVQLAKTYGLPIYASAGVTESKIPDVQAGCEKALAHLLVALVGGDCIHLAAGMLDSGNSVCYEQYVIDNEIIGMVHRILAGIKVDEDTLALEVIQKVGHGGNFVMEDHTIEHMTDEFFYPIFSERHLFDVWDKKGRPSMLTRAGEWVKKTLAETHKNPIDPGLDAEIRKAFPGIQEI